MKEKNVKAKAPNKKVLGLTTKIFIALLAGASVLLKTVPDLPANRYLYVAEPLRIR